VSTSLDLCLFPSDELILLPLHVEDVGSPAGWEALPFDFGTKRQRGLIFERSDGTNHLTNVAAVLGVSWAAYVLIFLETLVHMHDRLLRNVRLVPRERRVVDGTNGILFEPAAGCGFYVFVVGGFFLDGLHIFHGLTLMLLTLRI